MSRIVIDARTLFWSGVGRYTIELLKQLEKIDRANTYLVLVRPQDRSLWQPTTANFSVVETAIDPYTPGEQFELPRRLKHLKPDLVHFVQPSVPAWYRGRAVTTVHDLTLTEHKNVRSSRLLYEAKYRVFKYVIRRAVHNAAALITPTDYQKQLLIKRYGRGAGDVHVAYEGASLPGAATTQKRLVRDPYLLYLGNFYPYKNLVRLVEALPAIRAARPDLKLVLAGNPDVFGEELITRAKQLGVADALILPGRVSDEQLASYYQHTELFVFPSLSEGFGLPGLEAMQYGAPVAAANATCLPEVYENAAVYFDPENTERIAEVIIDTLNDPKKLAELKAAGPKQVKKYSWERMAKETLAVYQAALKK